MTAVELLRSDANNAHSEFMKSLDGVTEKLAWAVMAPAGEEYLHTDGSIHGIALHVAGCKMMYGSICFRNTEMRWRDLADQIEAFEPSWSAAVDFVAKAHEYWMASWAHLTDADLETMIPTNYKKDWPAWEMIRVVSQHDCYHAGQVAVLRYGLVESDVKPPSSAEDVRKYCRESVHW